MNWPQLTIIGLAFMGLGVHLAKNGEPYKHPHSFLTKLVAVSIDFFILYKGGFFG